MKTVTINGCCVSRDIFNYADEWQYKVNKFVQLNPISCFSVGAGITCPAGFSELKWHSPFIKSCMKTALQQELQDVIAKNVSDLLILDLADERIHKVKVSQPEISKEVVYANHNFFHNMTDYFEASEEYEVKHMRFCEIPWDTVKRRYAQFSEYVLKQYAETEIFIIEVFLAEKYIDADYRIKTFSEKAGGYSQNYIREANAYLHKCYEYLETCLPNAKRVRLPENILGVSWHRWGLNPLHYTSATYQYCLDCIKVLSGDSNQNSVNALLKDCEWNNYMLLKNAF